MPMGARAAAALVRAPPHTTPPSAALAAALLALLVISSNTLCAYADPEDINILLKFKSTMANVGFLQTWTADSQPCVGDQSNWNGVLCWQSHVWGLQLENLGLTGQVNVDPLVPLPHFRTISFMNNALDGPFPSLNKLPGLKSIYLSNNRFSGPIPDNAFAGMSYLKKVYLHNNKFSGNIPSSLTTLPRLLELRLDGNRFVGTLPNFKNMDLKLVNVSNNLLAGPIPPALSKLPSSSFQGNEELCGQPLEPCSAASPPAPPGVPPVSSDKNPKKSSGTKIVVIVLAIALALVAMALIFLLCCRKQQSSQLDRMGSLNSQCGYAAPAVDHIRHPTDIPAKNVKKAEQGKLTFVRDDRERFDLHDLLRASAEVLGSGNFGASYKAAVFNGQGIVVKRFKLMNNVGREDFHEHMRRLGRLRHQNLLPLVAYYFRKEEKLLVFDFVENGSLASHLHGNHTKDQQGLDWPARLKIIKGVVKGMAYLFSELPSLMLPHGHLKSSNVLLNESFEPLLMDYALVPLVNTESAQQLMVAYKSPEYAQLGRTLKKTDVWSIGILILEVLTGRFPAGYLTQGSGSDADLVTWVQAIASEESSPGVFDKDMGGRENAEGQMQKLLKIGLAACAAEVEQRWDIREVVEKVEELEERDTGNA